MTESEARTMDPRIEALARAICAGDDQDPEALVAVADEAGDRREVPRWQTRTGEARRIIATFAALDPPDAPTAADPIPPA